MAGEAGSSTFDVVVTRTFNVPVDRLWRAWSDPEDVRQWWGPMGFTCPVADMDVRDGGRSLVCMRAPAEYGGGDMYSTWTYTKLVSGERMEYTFNFSDASGNRLTPVEAGISLDVPADGRHVVTFTDAGDGTSELTVVEHGYASREARDMSKAGLEQCLDKMAVAIGG